MVDLALHTSAEYNTEEKWGPPPPHVHSRTVEVTDTSLERKGPVKLIQRVKIAHSFLQSVSNMFHFIILSLPM